MFIRYRSEGFWAYDVGVGVFLKHLIDCAGKHAQAEDAAWLRDCIDRWRFNAVISDAGLYLDEAWSGDQIQTVVRLMDEACVALGRRIQIPADEMQAWDLLEGKGVFARGEVEFPTTPAIELGHAIQAILVGRLPPAPPGAWWYYGAPPGRHTIPRRS
jgi:hypothetical protein